MSAPLTRYLVSSVRPLRKVIRICVANPHVGRGDRVLGDSQMGLGRNTFRNFSTNYGPKFSKDGDSPGTPQADGTSAIVEEPVIIDRVEHLRIMTIGINRPKKRNSVNEETAVKLREAFEAFEADEEAHVAVLHGFGGNFCAGYDLEELAGLDKDQLNNLIAVNMLESGPMGPTRMQFTKPVIAAIEGWCVGGGLELALMCDLRIMDETAQLGILNRRFGVPLLDGGAVRLPRLIGLSRAMDLILTGRIVAAEEALQIGLVNRLCKPGTALGQALNLAKEIIVHPQQCLRVDRDSAYHATYSTKNLAQALQYEGDNALSVISHESIQGAKKFASGLGRHGKFNVSPVAEKQEWQKELDTMVEEDKKKTQ